MGKKKDRKAAKKAAIEAIKNADAFILSTCVDDEGETTTQVFGGPKRVAYCLSGIEDAVKKMAGELAGAIIKRMAGRNADA